MNLSAKSEDNRFTAARLKSVFNVRWGRNTLWPSCIILFAPPAAAMLYQTVFKDLLPYLILTCSSIFAVYLIYRSSIGGLNAKTEEAEALGRLHLATAEALATAIDAKDQTSHCHVRRVQIYAAGMGEVFGLSELEIAALKAGSLF